MRPLSAKVFALRDSRAMSVVVVGMIGMMSLGAYGSLHYRMLVSLAVISDHVDNAQSYLEALFAGHFSDRAVCEGVAARN